MSGYEIYIFLKENGLTVCKQWRPWSDVALPNTMGKIVSNFLPVSIFFCFLFLPVVMPELVKMYNAGNSAVDISNIVYFR